MNAVETVEVAGVLTCLSCALPVAMRAHRPAREPARRGECRVSELAREHHDHAPALSEEHVLGAALVTYHLESIIEPVPA